MSSPEISIAPTQESGNEDQQIPVGATEKPVGPESTPAAPGTQTASANIRTLADSNIDEEEGEPVWKGDSRYFQTGKRQGQLRPAAMRAPAPTAPAGEFEGLQIGGKGASPIAPPAPETEPAKKPTKNKKLEARTGAKLVMRTLDNIVHWISGGEFGKDFTDEQSADRNRYRDQCEKDWADYLETLDIPLHPGLIAAFSTMNYVAPAFTTKKGQERAKTFKEKIIGKAVSFILRRGE